MQLTKREYQVLTLVCNSDKQIAKQLGISLSTAHTYIIQLFNKFVVNNRSQLLVEALRQNAITLEDIVLRLE